jgi:hypothetical protein
MSNVISDIQTAQRIVFLVIARPLSQLAAKTLSGISVLAHLMVMVYSPASRRRANYQIIVRFRPMPDCANGRFRLFERGHTTLHHNAMI